MPWHTRGGVLKSGDTYVHVHMDLICMYSVKKWNDMAAEHCAGFSSTNLSDDKCVLHF